MLDFKPFLESSHQLQCCWHRVYLCGFAGLKFMSSKWHSRHMSWVETWSLISAQCHPYHTSTLLEYHLDLSLRLILVATYVPPTRKFTGIQNPKGVASQKPSQGKRSEGQPHRCHSTGGHHRWRKGAGAWGFRKETAIMRRLRRKSSAESNSFTPTWAQY